MAWRLSVSGSSQPKPPSPPPWLAVNCPLARLPRWPTASLTLVAARATGRRMTRLTVTGAAPPNSAEPPRRISTRSSSPEGMRPTSVRAKRALAVGRSPLTRNCTPSRDMPRARAFMPPSAPCSPASMPGSLRISSPTVRPPRASISLRSMMVFCVAALRWSSNAPLAERTVTSPSWRSGALTGEDAGAGCCASTGAAQAAHTAAASRRAWADIKLGICYYFDSC